MTDFDIALGTQAGAPAERTTARRVALASFGGTMIEQYDFAIYGAAAALVFPHTLFPALGTAAAAAVSFATFGVAFVARPVGGIVFGHFGDRLGRKATLVSTLLLMGVATVLIGAMPSASQIGVVAPILVVLLRVVQGLAAGGEWAGATLFSAEHAPEVRRGLWTMFPLLGGCVAFALANLTFLVTGFGMSDEAFVSWGWRIPFLCSILLVAVGLWARLKIDETPVFKEEQARGEGAGRGSGLPIAQCFRSQPREILLAGGIGLTVFSFFYVSGTFLVTFATDEIGVTRNFVLASGFFGGLVLTGATVLGAVLSDRLGRRPVLLTANVVGVIWSLSLFPILNAGGGMVFAMALFVTMLIAGVGYGPMGSFIPELFATRYRFTATGFSYNLGTVVGGAAAPLVAAPLIAAHGTAAFGLFLASLAAVGVVCTVRLGETRGASFDRF